MSGRVVVYRGSVKKGGGIERECQEGWWYREGVKKGGGIARESRRVVV